MTWLKSFDSGLPRSPAGSLAMTPNIAQLLQTPPEWEIKSTSSPLSLRGGFAKPTPACRQAGSNPEYVHKPMDSRVREDDSEGAGMTLSDRNFTTKKAL